MDSMKTLFHWLKLVLVTVPLHKLKWFFSFEAELIRKKAKVADAGSKHSVFVFSTHKCASTFLNSLISSLAQFENRKHVDIETYLATKPAVRDELYADTDFTIELLKRKGYYFGVFRYGFAGLPEITGQKIVLVLRDPRDVLTSQYFSIAYSHPVLTKKFLAKRKNALETGIDAHVLEMTPRFLKTYTDYIQKYGKRKDVLLVRYEDLIAQFNETLLSILNFIEYSETEKALSYWKAHDPFIAGPEDIHKHRRKMLPGDHKEKLKPATIHELNDRFAAVLAFLGHK